MKGERPEDWLWLLNIVLLNVSYAFIGIPLLIDLRKRGIINVKINRKTNRS